MLYHALMTLRVELLGQARVLGENGWEPLPQDKRGALLAVLACHGDWLSREKLAFLFWPDVPDEQARVNLRQLLVRVKALAFAQDLDVEARRLRWAATSDVSAFREAQACGQWETAAALYQGRLLGDFELLDAPEFSSWLELERREFEDRYRQAVARASARLEHSGDVERALALWASLLEHDPLDEHGVQQVLRLAVASEQTAAALQLHARFEERLSRELGLRPQAATQDLAEKVRRSTSAPERLQTERRYQLPSAAAYLGRDFEITELLHFLGQRERRLVTLLGPGGIGKTALALQVAREAASQFPDGVAFAPLAALQDAALIPSTVASALGLYLRPGEAPEARLLSFLRGKALLLVLDNLEHLPGGADFIGRILESCPKLTVLATSRSRLKLQSEWLFPVEGLSYPQQDDESPLESYDAVRLFVLRARQVQPDFALTAVNREAVRRICQRVVGAPLALELAAGWTRLLSCQEIADALSESLDALQGELHDLPERHQSLRAVFEHSWQLLSPEEQTVLSQLSVFQGGFEREAAKAITGASASVLLALLDKSLLKRNADGRFDLHELVRQYAAEKLDAEASEERKARTRHADYFAQFVRAREPFSQGQRLPQAIRELEADLDNLRHAWRFAVEEGSEALIELMANGLWELYEIRGFHEEGEAALSAAAQRLQADSPILATLLGHLGAHLHRLGKLSECEEVSRRSLRIAKRLEEPPTWTAAYNLAAVALLRSNWDEAERRHCEVLDLGKKYGNRYLIGAALVGLGNIAHTRGNFEEAEHYYEEVLELWRDNLWAQSITLSNLGLLFVEQGDYKKAETYLKSALETARAIGHTWIIEGAHVKLGDLALRQNHLGTAEEHLREALRLADEMGSREERELVLTHLGLLACERQRYILALERFREVLGSAVDRDARASALNAVVGVAKVLSSLGQDEEALELLAFAFAQPELQAPWYLDCDVGSKARAEQLYRDLAARLPAAFRAAAEDQARALSYADILQRVRAHPLAPQTETSR